MGATVLLLVIVLVSPPAAREVLAKRVIQGDTLYQVLPRDAFEALVTPEGVPVSAADTLAHPDEPFLGVVINGRCGRPRPRSGSRGSIFTRVPTSSADPFRSAFRRQPERYRPRGSCG